MNFNERIAELAELGNCARKGSLVYDTIKETALPLLREMQQALSEVQAERDVLTQNLRVPNFNELTKPRYGKAS